MAPTSEEAQAIALFQSGRFGEAEAAFRAVLAREPMNANALHALGVIAMRARRFEEAQSLLGRAAEADPRLHAVFYHLGSALRQGGKHEEALAAFRRSLSLQPRSAEAHAGLGNTLREMGWRAEARESFRAALRLDPALAAARTNLALLETEEGNARKDEGDLDAALERYGAALALDPDQAAALLNSGSVALERGDRPTARRFYERALRSRPGLADAQYGLGVIDLFEHDFARGWAGYERRFDTMPPAAAVAPPHRPRVATLEALATVRRLAVRAEQGLGDQVLFSTLLPELRARNVAAVIELDPRLASIYRRSLPQFDYPAPSDVAALAACDHELPLGCLPRLFRLTRESFAAQPAALLAADPQRVREIEALLPEGRKVAISWRSFQQAGRRHIAERKSVALERFAALEACGVRLVDVQYGEVAEERRAFDERHPGLRFEVPGLDVRDDLEGLFATLGACDLVVTSSNVTAHFAGALGKRTLLVYLGANPPFHYWSPGPDGRSLWYPCVEIVTDAAWTRWETAFETLADLIQRKE